jgi:hypothetical protein
MKAGADSDDAFSRGFLVLGAPGTVVIGPDGIIAADWRGPISLRTLLDFLRASYPDIVIPAAGSGKSDGS